MSQEQWIEKIPPEIVIANKVLAVCLATTSVTSAWALPLFDTAFDTESELRNRLFCLLVSGLLDSGWEYRNRLNALKIEAGKVNVLAGPFYLDMFEKYIALAVEMLEMFSRDEMIAITSCRDGWLHGQWTEVHKENRTIYYAEKGKILRTKVSWVDYNKALQNMLSRGVDQALSDLRKRFSQYRTFFWVVDRALSAEKTRNLIQQDLLLRDKFRGPNVVLIIPDPTFKPDPTKNDAYRSLIELGPQITSRSHRINLIAAWPIIGAFFAGIFATAFVVLWMG